MTVESPWMTPAEVATYTRRSYHNVHVALRAGDLKGEQPSGPMGKWLIHRDEVDAWIKRRTAA